MATCVYAVRLEQELLRIALDSIQEDKIMLHRLLHSWQSPLPMLAGTIDPGDPITHTRVGRTYNLERRYFFYQRKLLRTFLPDC